MEPQAPASPIPVLFQILFALWTVVLTLWLFRYSIQHSGPASWDGYERCAWGANIWLCLRTGDLPAFWHQTHAQIIWPFLHSWLAAAMFFLFGPSLQSARMICLLSFAGVALSCLCFFRREKENAPFLMGIAAWLLFTSSPFSLQHAASIMSELPGLFLAVLALYFFPKDHSSHRGFLISGFFTGLLFFHKYNFAFLTLAGIGASVLIHTRFRLVKLFAKPYRYYYGILFAMLLFLFLPQFERKWNGLVEFAFNNPNARMPFDWSALLYYPTQIPQVFFISPFIAWLTVPLLVCAVWIKRLAFVEQPLFMCFAAHFLAAMIHPMKDIRFMFIPMGLYFLLAGQAFGIVFLTNKPLEKCKPLLIGILALSPLVAALHFPFYSKPYIQQGQIHAPVFAALKSQLDQNDRVGFLVAHETITPPAISFSMIAMFNRLQRSSNEERLNWDYLFLFQNQEETHALSRQEQINQLRHELFIRGVDKVVQIISLHPETIPRFQEIFGGAYEMRGVIDSLPEFSKIEDRVFQNAGLRLTVYELTGQ